MHGPGYPPQQRPRPAGGSVVTMRVLFALLPVLSCGMLAFGTLIRLAVVTRRPRDWALSVADGVLIVACLALVGEDPTEDASTWMGNTGMITILTMAVVVTVYFLYSDIKHWENAAAAPAGWYPPAPPVTPHYGYPPVDHTPAPGHTQPPGRTTVPMPHQPAPHQPAPQQAPQQTPQPAPQQAPQPHQPPRIGQVRAELDELSELLRRQQGEQGR
ncbi:hypothetical protein [Streptomyces sp. NPDC089799]|uniref:hypothetical protein n=1 Tax=Streptomyces sp. NPDC089799 TaxID=3155066 RepID=UPI003444EE56